MIHSLEYWYDVGQPDKCWPWKGGKSNGYGMYHNGEILIQAHIAVYISIKGIYDRTLTLDHICRNRECVNPNHLEPVTRGINTLRGNSPHAINSRLTHCINGHEFSDKNAAIAPNGQRVCRACKRENIKRYRLLNPF